jgi:hypothetical protein
LADETYAAGLRDVLGEFRSRALFMLDEAHHAAPSGGARYAISSQFTKAVRDIAERFEHRLFLSATPHNGHSNSFSASGNARVRRGMIQLAWRFLWLQKDSALAEWYRQRTQTVPGARKTLIVALARKLLIALWRLVHDGIVPEDANPGDPNGPFEVWQLMRTQAR